MILHYGLSRAGQLRAAPILFATLILLLSANPPARAQLGMDDFISGDFLLQTAKQVGGTIEFEFDGQNAFKSLTAKKGVYLNTPDFEIACDVLTYNVSKDEIRAIGAPVHITLRQGGQDTKATCRNFHYTVGERKAVLSGDPVIRGAGGGGLQGNTSGERITLIQKPGGGMRILIDSSAQARAMVLSEGDRSDDGGTADKESGAVKSRLEKSTRSEPAVLEVRQEARTVAKEAKPPAVAKPERLDGDSLDKIPEVSTGDDG